MRPAETHSRAARRLPPPLVAFCLLLALGAGENSRAQSGRRVPRTTDSRAARADDAVAPAESPSPPPPKSPAEDAPRFSVVIAGRINSDEADERAKVILASFLKRLKDAPNVTSAYAGEMKREQATKRAQGEREAFVVHVELETDHVQGWKVLMSTPDLIVKYQVFAPGTGKSKMKGRVYFQPAGGARARKESWPGDPPIKMTPEAAGIEVAERVLAWLVEHRLYETPRVIGSRQ